MTDTGEKSENIGLESEKELADAEETIKTDEKTSLQTSSNENLLAAKQMELDMANKIIEDLKKDLDDARMQQEAAASREISVLEKAETAEQARTEALKQASVAEQAKQDALEQLKTAQTTEQELLQKITAAKELLQKTGEQLNSVKDSNTLLIQQLQDTTLLKEEAATKLGDAEKANNDMLERLIKAEDLNKKGLQQADAAEKLREDLQKKLSIIEDAREEAIRLVASGATSLEAEREDLIEKLSVAEEEKEKALQQLVTAKKTEEELLDELTAAEEEKERLRVMVSTVEASSSDTIDAIEEEMKELQQKLLVFEQEKEKALQQAAAIAADTRLASREREAPQSKESATRNPEDVNVTARAARLKQRLVEKAGVEPISYKIAYPNPSADSKKKKSKPNAPKRHQIHLPPINVKELVEYFNDQIKDVFQKEQIALMLAEELTEHHMLQNKRDDLSTEEMHNLTHNQEVKSNTDEWEELDIAIEAKRRNVLILSKGLGIVVDQNPLSCADSYSGTDTKSYERSPTKMDFKKRNLLTSDRFKSINLGQTPLTTLQAACKVLFGMLIQERKNNNNFDEPELKTIQDVLNKLHEREEEDHPKVPTLIERQHRPVKQQPPVRAANPSPSKPKAKAKVPLNANVFSRLTDPRGFTGIQKQKMETPTKRTPKKHVVSTPDPSPAVFERLQSPVNYTGVQKAAHASTHPDHEFVDDIIIPNFDSPTKRDLSKTFSSPSKMSEGTPEHDIEREQVLKSSTRDWVANYGNRNVFERLQESTTTSFTAKSRK